MSGPTTPRATRFSFIDLFAGCGGLSLGLLRAGGQGIFAVEKSDHAFATFRENLLSQFHWPDWLPQEARPIRGLLSRYRDELSALRGTIDVVVGGPPCQGFSVYGKRNSRDARNALYTQQLRMVDLLNPAITLIENVPGIGHRYRSEEVEARELRRQTTYESRIRSKLRHLGYEPYTLRLCSSTLGVPQERIRVFILGIRADHSERACALLEGNAFRRTLAAYRRSHGFAARGRVSVREALSDLEVRRCGIRPSDTPGFKEVRYRGPRTNFQRSMRTELPSDTPPSSIRLPNHTSGVRARFRTIQRLAIPGRKVPYQLLRSLDTSKHRVHLLSASTPSPTITTLPDDFVHYAEPRVLTVREFARLQTFPDSFKFLGPYTSGGDRRRKQCPQYTQVANAVPVRVAEFLGSLILQILAPIQPDHGPQDQAPSTGKALSR